MEKTTFREKLRSIILDTVRECSQPYFQGTPAQIAYYLFMSVAPLLVLFGKALSLFSLTVEQLEEWAGMFISDAAVSYFISHMTSGSGFSIVLAVTAVWAASKAQFSLSRVTNRIMSDGEFTGHGFFKDRIRSIIVMIILLISLVLAIVALVYLPPLLHFLLGNNVATSFLSSVWGKMRWLVVLVLYFLVISAVYISTPHDRPKFRDVLPGSIFSSVGFLLTAYIYKLIWTYSTTRNILYGSISTIIFMLLWLLAMSIVICAGVAFNKACIKYHKQ